MKTMLLVASLALVMPAISVQHTRRMIPAEVVKSPAMRGRAALPQAHPTSRVKALAAAPAQAPGVVQINLQDSARRAWFVTTAPVPAGATFDVSISLDNQSMLQLNSVQFTEDLAPGQSYALPDIGSFGDFSSDSIVTYAVMITVNGRQTQAAADFTVGAPRSYAELQDVVPLIASTMQTISGSRDAMLVIKGVFTSQAPYVVLDGTAVPVAAVTVSPGEIDVNLSKVPGLDLSSAWDYLVTAGQGGWSDTAVFRYVPPAPGTYNPAP